MTNVTLVNETEFHVVAVGPVQLTRDVGASDMAATAKRIDFVGDTLLYRGEATPGSLDTDPVWRIKRIAFDADGDVVETWANGTAEFNKVWSNRESYSYQ